MGRRVSPLFAVIVIIVALALRALYFMARLRAYDAEQAKTKQEMQAEAERAIEWRRQMERSGGLRGRRVGGRPSRDSERRGGTRTPVGGGSRRSFSASVSW